MSTKITHISKLSQLSTSDIGQTVRFFGWVESKRVQGSGSMVFADINDGTLVYEPVRCIIHQPQDETTSTVHTYDPHDERALSWDKVCLPRHLSLGCSVQVIGQIVEPPPKTSQQFEIQLTEVVVLDTIEDLVSYPIQKSILKNLPALRKHYHKRFRAPIIRALSKIRAKALYSVHEWFHLDDTPLLDPNIITSSDCEGAGEIFSLITQEPQVVTDEETGETSIVSVVDEETGVSTIPLKNVPTSEFFSSPHDVGLTVSSQLPLEAIAMGTNSVYTCQKSFRAEKSDTSKHLAEFLHVEYEKYFITLDELLTYTEKFVKFVIGRTLDYAVEAYQFLNDAKKSPEHVRGRDAKLREYLAKDFVRIKHADAITLMQADIKDKAKWVSPVTGKTVRFKPKVYPKHGEDLSAEHESYLTQKFETFIFVTHWPSAIKSFYMKQNDDGTCDSFDLLAPLVGELFGGSMREWRHDVLIEVMKKRKMEVGPLQWFVDLRKDGSAPHGGWGMGFDRLVMFLTGVQSVRDIVPYPVYFGHCAY